MKVGQVILQKYFRLQRIRDNSEVKLTDITPNDYNDDDKTATDGVTLIVKHFWKNCQPSAGVKTDVTANSTFISDT